MKRLSKISVMLFAALTASAMNSVASADDIDKRWQQKIDAATNALEANDYAHALDAIEEAHGLAWEIGQKDERFMKTLNLHIRILYAQGRLTEAEPYVKQSIPVLTVLFGKDSPEVAEARKNYAQLLRRLGKPTEKIEPAPVALATPPVMLPGERLLKFPPSTSASGSVFAYTDPANFREISLGYATGFVKVPPGKDVRINFSTQTRGSQVLFDLSKLGPNDIQVLGIYESDITESQLQQLLSQLAGLQWLELRGCERLSPAAINKIRNTTRTRIDVSE